MAVFNMRFEAFIDIDGFSLGFARYTIILYCFK